MSLQQDQVEKAGLEKNGKMVGHQGRRSHSTHKPTLINSDVLIKIAIYSVKQGGGSYFLKVT